MVLTLSVSICRITSATQRVAQDAGIQGKVMIRFVVERDGSATAVEVYKSVDPRTRQGSCPRGQVHPKMEAR